MLKFLLLKSSFQIFKNFLVNQTLGNSCYILFSKKSIRQMFYIRPFSLLHIHILIFFFYYFLKSSGKIVCKKWYLPLLAPSGPLSMVHSSIVPKGLKICLTSSSVCCLLNMPTNSLRSILCSVFCCSCCSSSCSSMCSSVYCEK